MEAEQLSIAQPAMGNHRHDHSGGCSPAPSAVVHGDSFELPPKRARFLSAGGLCLLGLVAGAIEVFVHAMG